MPKFTVVVRASYQLQTPISISVWSFAKISLFVFFSWFIVWFISFKLWSVPWNLLVLPCRLFHFKLLLWSCKKEKKQEIFLYITFRCFTLHFYVLLFSFLSLDSLKFRCFNLSVKSWLYEDAVCKKLTLRDTKEISWAVLWICLVELFGKMPFMSQFSCFRLNVRQGFIGERGRGNLLSVCEWRCSFNW